MTFKGAVPLLETRSHLTMRTFNSLGGESDFEKHRLWVSEVDARRRSRTLGIPCGTYWTMVGVSIMSVEMELGSSPLFAVLFSSRRIESGVLIISGGHDLRSSIPSSTCPSDAGEG
jgi:hypothetical protein